MDSLTIQGVRCYGEVQTVPIRPVTLLVGENSTGKSTLLAMVRVAWDIAFSFEEPSFNEEPFDFGGYHAIAYYHGGQGKFAHDFSIGSTYSRNIRGGRKRARSTAAMFKEHAGQPYLAEWELLDGTMRIRAARSGDMNDQAQVQLFNDGAIVFEDTSPLPLKVPLAAAAPNVVSRAGRFDDPKLKPFLPLIFERELRAASRPTAGAPIRSRPERTYNPRREKQEPEGSHVPFALASLNSTNASEYEKLATEMSAFGADAGLFSKLKVKRLGNKAGDPFQLQVAVDKFPFNVRDVGYGVSQILPILVDALTESRDQTFLLQQPEVHLHPRAQAALGSFFLEQADTRGQTFVVETHSDYLLDRVRMDIRDKKTRLNPEQVVILYFERIAGRASIKPIRINENGDLVAAPPGYRSFFLQEEKRLLGM